MNAIRHMGDRHDLMIKIEVRGHRGAILTRISDNGIGIPAQHLGKIFDRFFRVPRPRGQAGTGLGLSIAKKIIDSHGGQIWAESELSRGTTFSFTLPKLNPRKRDGRDYLYSCALKMVLKRMAQSGISEMRDCPGIG